MKFLDFFAGIGGFRMGFEQVGHECVGHVEWDKYAQASYAAIYGQGREEEYANEFNGWDITTITGADLPRADLWNFGAPCQDFSMAGKRAGLGGERSSLVQEVFRLYRETAEENRPTYLIYENVKGMLSSNGGRDFLAIITEMESLGFVVEWGMLNSKYWGVPQNRERVFTVGTRIDKWNGPIMQDLLLAQEVNGVQTKLRDVLEDSVDEKYYLAPDKTDRLVMQLENRNKADEQESDIQVIGNVGNTGYGAEDVLGIDGISKTLLSRDYKGPKQILEGLPIKEATRQGYDIATEGDSVNLQYPDSTTRRGRVGKGLANTLQATSDSNQGVVEQFYVDNISENQSFAKRKSQKMLDENGYLPKMYNPFNEAEIVDIAPTLTTICDRTTNSSTVLMKQPNYRIRKLTPKECWRLQGFPDWAFDLASGACSDSQLYKQAGNSVSVPVIAAIAEKLGI